MLKIIKFNETKLIVQNLISQCTLEFLIIFELIQAFLKHIESLEFICVLRDLNCSNFY
jgi:hypothetical protein